MKLSCQSVAVVLTLGQTEQIRINIRKRSNIKTQYKKYKTQYKYYQNTHTTAKTPPHSLPHTLQNKLK